MYNLKVSIITVCLNSAKTIEQTIQSVVGQSYSNIEYIIIDGGSTDGTLNIIRQYEEHITYWGSESDHGIYDAMNKGIAKSTGDIIGIINSDDWYAKNTIHEIVAYFNEHPEIEVVHGDLVAVSETGEQKLVKGISPQLEKAGDWYSHPTVFVKKHIYQKFGMYDLRYSILSDGAFMLKLKYNKVVIGNIPHILAYFRLGGACNTSRYRWKRIMEMQSIMGDAMKQPGITSQMRCEMGISRDRFVQKELLNYALSRMKRYNYFHLFFEHILKMNKKETFVFWGMGDDGANLGNLLGNNIDMLHAYIDSDDKKEGKLFLGKQILNPKSLNKKWYIVITTRNYSAQICNYLTKRKYIWGIDFMTYDDFVYNFLIGAFPKLLKRNMIQRDCICKRDKI